MGAAFAGVDSDRAGSVASQFKVTGGSNCSAQKAIGWSVFDLADRCKLDLKPWKRTIRNQGVNLAGALTKSLSVMRLGCWSSGFGRPSSWPENWECRAGA